MKITLRLVLSALIAIPASLMAQSLPNGDMETWEPLLLGGGEKPQSWDTPDVIAGALGITDRVVEKTDMAQSGAFAAQLTTKDLEAPAPIGTLTVPGTLALGTIIFDPLTLETGVVGGMAVTEGPESLVGYYMYSPAAGDTMNVTVLAKKDGEIIGNGTYRDAATTTSYQSFEATISYFTADEPDTIQVIITSSGGFTSAVTGSVLHIDNMSFTGISSVDGIAGAGIGFTVYPNPTSDFVHITNAGNTALTAELFNINGIKMGEYIINNGVNQIDVRNFPAGMYLARVSENGKKMYAAKFNVSE
jgi:hypothetical protein